MNTENKRFGDLKPGDKIIGADGQAVEISDVYEKHLPESMYQIEMEDGEVVNSSGNHLWYSESELDKKGEFMYRNLAQHYFRQYKIPEKLEEDELFPLRDMMKIFGSHVMVVMFIEEACKSLGYSSYTPHLIYDDKMKVAGHKEVIFNYSYNDLIDFLHQMKSAVVDNKGYFYFGQVRTTEQIAELVESGMEVNIPHKSDIITQNN